VAAGREVRGHHVDRQHDRPVTGSQRTTEPGSMLSHRDSQCHRWSRRRKTGLFLAPLQDRLQRRTRIERRQYVRSLGAHRGPQRLRLNRIHDTGRIAHHAVRPSSVGADQSTTYLERDELGIAFERVAPAPSAPCDEMQYVALVDVDIVHLAREHLAPTLGAVDPLAPTRTGSTTVDAPRIREPTVVMDRDRARLPEPVRHLDTVAAAMKSHA